MQHLMIKLSPELKSRFAEYCEQNDVTKSEVVRVLIALITGYDITKDDYSMGPSRENPEERARMKAQSDKKRRELVEAMLADVKESERNSQYDSLKKTLDESRRRKRQEMAEVERYIEENTRF